jgi:hypothetical protein
MRSQPTAQAADTGPHIRNDPAPQQAPTVPIQTAVPPPTAPAATPAVDERPVVELVLREYARALSAGDLDAAGAAYPGMPANVRKGLSEMIQKKYTYDTSRWRYLDVVTTGNTATAQLGGITTIKDNKGKKVSEESWPRKATLSKGSSGWKLVTIE